MQRKWLAIVLLSMPIAQMSTAHDFYVYRSDLTSDQVAPPIENTLSNSSATLEMRFDGDAHNGGPLAFYSIQLEGLDLDGLQSETPEDDVIAIRFRIGPTGENGPHALNVFAASGSAFRSDDAEVVIDFTSGVLEGVWNNADATRTGENETRLDTDSLGISEAAQPLIEGNLYLEILTAENPDGLLRGQVVGANSLKIPRYFPSGDFQLSIYSSSPREINVERSSSLEDWNGFTNLVTTVGLVRMNDSPAENTPQSFYRISESFIRFPHITGQPEDASVAAGATATFVATVGGTPPFFGQWFHNGQALSDAGQLELVVPDVNSSHAGSYYLVVSNLVGSATSTSANLNLTR